VAASLGSAKDLVLGFWLMMVNTHDWDRRAEETGGQ
jgi:hypothetical protein